MSHYDELRYAEYMKEIENDPQTPQEISEYKRRWMAKAHSSINFHSDLSVKAKDWCRRNMKRHEWSMSTWSNVYEHTLHFECPNDASSFQEFITQ
jgi:hypothetical protein